MASNTIRTAALALVLVAASASPAAAWGPIGHRVGAEIAERNISGHTRAHIERILGAETLREASNVPDEERSNPDEFWQREAGPYHYVTLPPGVPADQLESPPEGDAFTALRDFAAILRDPQASAEQKALALRFTVHLVGDIHMPLHVGRPGDRGGNDVFVMWADGPANLHWVWDEGLIAKKQISATEYSRRLLPRITPDDTIAWWDARPQTWIQESAALREQIYPSVGGERGKGRANRRRGFRTGITPIGGPRRWSSG